MEIPSIYKVPRKHATSCFFDTVLFWMVKFSMKYIRSLQNQTIYKSIIKGFLELNLLSSMQQLNANFILESHMQVVPFNLWLTILQFTG